MDKGDRIKTVIAAGRTGRIAVVSDTHIPARARALPPWLFELLQGVELILHAGDLVDDTVLDELRALAPVEAVAGNMDPYSLHRSLGRKKLVRIGAVTVGLVHGDGSRSNTLTRALETFRQVTPQPQAIVFGHSHRPLCRHYEGILMFNPGSATDPRRSPQPSCGFLTVEGGKINGEIVYFQK